MRNQLRYGIALVLAAAAAPALAGPTVRAAISQDNSFDTRYRAGDKPISPGAECPTGWTCAVKGTGGGEIDEVSSTSFEIVASGADDEGDIIYAYQTCSTDDCEIIARLPDPDTWTGHIETFSAFIVGISEGTGDSAWYMQAWGTPDGRVRCKAGTPGPDDLNQISVADILPEYLAVTRDKSSGEWRCLQSDDGVTYTTLGTFTRTFAGNPIVYVGGTSHDTTATTTATLTNIDFNTSITTYTPPTDPPDPPPTNNAPVFTGVPNQSGTVGSAYSFSVVTPTAYCTDADSDPLTYSASGLPSGLTMSSAGTISGTPTTSQTVNATLTCTDNEAAFDTDVVQFAIAPSSGDTINWTSAMGHTRTCAQLGAGPGDTIVIQGDGNNWRPNMELSNCTGTASSRIRVVNDVTESTPLRIGSSGGGDDFLLTIRASEYVDIDGRGKYVGAPARGCGRATDTDKMADPVFPRGCGIQVVREATGGTQPSGQTNSGIKMRAGNRFVRFFGVEIDGNDTGIRIGFSGNDHTYLLQGGTQLQCQQDAQDGPPVSRPACEWIEGVEFNDGYIHDTVAEAVYIGSNFAQDGDLDLPIRGAKLNDNIVVDSGYDALSIKSCIDDTGGYCEISGNYVDGAGTAGIGLNGNTGACADTWEGGYTNVFNNVLKNCEGAGINHANKHRPASYGPLPVNDYNNIIVDADVGNTGKKGINVANNTSNNGASAQLVPTIYNNTIVRAGGGAIDVSSTVNNCTVRDNLATGNATEDNINDAHCTGNGGISSTVADAAFAGATNFRLTASSPACNQSSSQAPPTDFEGETRPQDSADDVGADEAAACPTN